MMRGQTFAFLCVAVAAQEGRPSSAHVGNFLAKAASPSTRDDPTEGDFDLCDGLGLDPSVSGSSPDCQKQDTCDFDVRLCDLALPCLVSGAMSFEQACVYTGVENIDYTIDSANILSAGSKSISYDTVRSCSSDEQEVDTSLTAQQSDSSEWHWDRGLELKIQGKLTESFGIPFVEKTRVNIELGMEIDVSGGQAFTHTSSISKEITTVVKAPAETETNVSVLCAQNKLEVPYNATLQAVCRLQVKSSTVGSLTPVQDVLKAQQCLVDLASKEEGFPNSPTSTVQAHVLRTGTFKSAQVSDCVVEIGRSLPISCGSSTGVQVISQANVSATEDTRHEP